MQTDTLVRVRVLDAAGVVRVDRNPNAPTCFTLQSPATYTPAQLRTFQRIKLSRNPRHVASDIATWLASITLDVDGHPFPQKAARTYYATAPEAPFVTLELLLALNDLRPRP